MDQAGTKVQILGLIHIIMYLSAIFWFPKINKLQGLRSAFLLTRVKNLWLALFAQFPCSYKLCKLCSSWTHTALFSHLLHSLAILEEKYSPPFLLFVFLLSILFNWDCKMRALFATLHAFFDSEHHSIKVV